MRSPSPWKLPKHPIATLEQEEINIAVKKFLNAGIIEECPDSRPYLVFENQGTIYKYKALNFGLNIAPRIFSKILRYAIEPLRK